MKSIYVFGYVNPDTDGVCSAIAYSELFRRASDENCQAVVFGRINAETEFVLRHFGANPPPVVSALPADSLFIIVDTHHPNQLPANINLKAVIEIFDHHPAGSPLAFPNARIHNESVGAVATLIAERMFSQDQIPSKTIAGLLASAIVSNTLNFVAPSTTSRDRASFSWLCQYVQVDSHFVGAMFDARSTIAQEATEQLLSSDYKQFEWCGVSVGICQLEVADAEQVIQRPTLFESLSRFRNSHGLNHLVFNVIDLSRATSTLCAFEEQTQDLLEKATGLTFAKGLAHSPRVLLRKTDLVPLLQTLLSGLKGPGELPGPLK